MKEDENVSIHKLQADERPRERMLQLGRSILADTELLAILIGSGSKSKSALVLARELLSTAGGLNALARWQVEDYIRVSGIGEAKAIRLLATFELGRRFPLDVNRQISQIKNSGDAYEHFLPVLADLRHEEFWVLYLSNANRVVAREKLSQGGMTGTVTDIRILFRKALQWHATGVILGHNHPSGNLEPSAADRKLTHKIIEAGKLMDVFVLDHLILTPNDYVSFADEGWISSRNAT